MKHVTAAETILLISQGVMLHNDTEDGHVEVKKKPGARYEIRFRDNATGKVDVLLGDYVQLLKFLNKYEGFYTMDNEK